MWKSNFAYKFKFLSLLNYSTNNHLLPFTMRVNHLILLFLIPFFIQQASAQEQENSPVKLKLIAGNIYEIQETQKKVIMLVEDNKTLDQALSNFEENEARLVTSIYNEVTETY
jgi:hypothetical protein